MLLWQLKLQKPLPWDQQIFLQKGLQQLLACTTGGSVHANMPAMHATPMLTWCCCGEAWATRNGS
jgi:hypothetical protein